MADARSELEELRRLEELEKKAAGRAAPAKTTSVPQYDPMGAYIGETEVEPAKPAPGFQRGYAAGAMTALPGLAGAGEQAVRGGMRKLAEKDVLAQKLGFGQISPQPVLPTPESLQKRFFGEPKTAAEAGGREVGTMIGAPGVAGAVSAIPKLGALPKIPGISRGPSAAESAERLRSSIPSVGMKAEEMIGRGTAQQLGETMARGTRRERSLREAEQRFTGEAQAAREASARKFADLGAPKDAAALGDEMQRRLTGTEFTRGARRGQRAEEDAKQYFAQARERGEFIASNEGKSFLNFLKSQMFSQRTTPAERKLAQDMYRDLGEARDIEAVEKTFRKYNEASKGAPKEGYDAVMQQYAGSISQELSNALNKFSPKRLEFRETYKDLSSPLDAYETAFGARGVAREKAVPERLKMMPTDYPTTYFKNRDTLRSLREQLAGDEAALRKFANQHVVNELAGKDAKAASTWLESNREWVNEIPGLRDRVANYVSFLDRSEKFAGEKAAGAQALEKKAREIVSGRQEAEETITGAGQKATERIRESLRQLELVPAEKVSAKTRQILQDLEASRLIDPARASKLRSEIDAVDKAFAGEEKSRRIKDLMVKYGLRGAVGGSAAYGAYQGYKAL